ncbi:hypothetical protein AOLI_G00000130 [Acnodon oligacanthus]
MASAFLWGTDHTSLLKAEHYFSRTPAGSEAASLSLMATWHVEFMSPCGQHHLLSPHWRDLQPSGASSHPTGRAIRRLRHFPLPYSTTTRAQVREGLVAGPKAGDVLSAHLAKQVSEQLIGVTSALKQTSEKAGLQKERQKYGISPLITEDLRVAR